MHFVSCGLFLPLPVSSFIPTLMSSLSLLSGGCRPVCFPGDLADKPSFAPCRVQKRIWDTFCPCPKSAVFPPRGKKSPPSWSSRRAGEVEKNRAAAAASGPSPPFRTAVSPFPRRAVCPPPPQPSPVALQGIMERRKAKSFFPWQRGQACRGTFRQQFSCSKARLGRRCESRSHWPLFRNPGAVYRPLIFAGFPLRRGRAGFFGAFPPLPFSEEMFPHGGLPAGPSLGCCLGLQGVGLGS